MAVSPPKSGDKCVRQLPQVIPHGTGQLKAHVAWPALLCCWPASPREMFQVAINLLKE